MSLPKYSHEALLSLSLEGRAELLGKTLRWSHDLVCLRKVALTDRDDDGAMILMVATMLHPELTSELRSNSDTQR